MIYIYHNPRCTKSRESLQLLEKNNCTFKVIEYLNDTPSKNELRSVLALLKLKPEAIIRKNETLYKENFKNKSFTDEEWLTILVENPKLIERPIIFDEKKAVIGRPPENVETFY